MIHALNLSLYGEALIRLLYPAYCGGCASPLELEEKNLCTTCHGQLNRLQLGSFEQLSETPIPGLDEVWSLYPYEGIAKKLISEIKFSGKRWLLSALSPALLECVKKMQALKSYHVIASIPTERSKLVEREFHLVDLIAKLLSKETRIPYQKNLLKKHRRTLAQSSLTREERLLNPQGSLKAKFSPKLNGARVLLIDDVFTTGATTREAALVLKASGAKAVDLLTIARTERKA